MVNRGYTQCCQSKTDKGGTQVPACCIDDPDDDCATEVDYELDLLGPSIPTNWRPAEIGEYSIVKIKSWELFAEGGGYVRSHSCIGGGDFDDPDTTEIEEEVWIEVTRTN